MINVLLCGGFFYFKSVLTRSVAEMVFSLAYTLTIAFVAVYHINEIGRRAGELMSYTSLFVGTQKKCKIRSHNQGRRP